MKTYLATLINAKKRKIRHSACTIKPVTQRYALVRSLPGLGLGAAPAQYGKKAAPLSKVVAAKAGHYATMRLGWAGAGEKHFYLGVALPAFVGDEFQQLKPKYMFSKYGQVWIILATIGDHVNSEIQTTIDVDSETQPLSNALCRH